MKIYISGKIGDISDPADEQAAIEKFASAQDLLESLGLEVENPLNNGLPHNAPWIRHLGRDLEILDGCDGIFMLRDWKSSRGAEHEFDFANRENKIVMFESDVIKTNQDVLQIQAAIQEATGIRFDQYITKSRKRDGFFARMLFVYHCRKRKMKLTQIAKFVHRDHSSMLHLLNKFDDEVKFNPYFRGLAEKVNDLLNKNNNARI